MADWIEVGKKAPDFTLADDDGTKIKLSSLRGNPVVLYFYPRDDTPGCTREACAFRDQKSKMTKLGATVLGVSTGPPSKATSKFRDKYKLNSLPLLDRPPSTRSPRSMGHGARKPVLAKHPWASSVRPSSSTPRASSRKCGRASRSTGTMSRCSRRSAS